MNFNDVVGGANQRTGVAGNTLAHGTGLTRGVEGGVEKIQRARDGKNAS